MSRSNMDKSTSQRIHFRERLYQRFGYDIDDVTYEAIIKKYEVIKPSLYIAKAIG